MSDTTSVICPGELRRMGEDSNHYLCVIVTVFYNQQIGATNTDYFYLHNYDIRPWNLQTRAKLMAEITARLKLNQGETRVAKAEYSGMEGMSLSDQDIADLKYRFIEGTDTLVPNPTPVPVPAPAPALPATTPEAEAVPPPSPEPPVLGMVGMAATESPRGRT